jgi:glutamine amidotransferase
MTNVCILNYGSGNVRSVFNLLSTVCNSVSVSNDPHDIKMSTHIILPGVGAFGASMRKFIDKIPADEIRDALFISKKPFLGICVGMQVMAERGFEFGYHAGLGWIPGVVDVIQPVALPLPHVGWNNIEICGVSPLLRQIKNKSDFYFVHSYAMKPSNPKNIIATTEYGETFCSIVQSENLFGVQFHPEKSQNVGQKLVENFLKI